MHPSQHSAVAKAGRKRRANGQLKSADSSLSFRDSLYSEKAAAMIESKSEVLFSSPASASPNDELAAGAFQFVDQSASSRREARRFVMRRSVWHRKQEQTRRLQGTVSPEMQPKAFSAPERKLSTSLSAPSSPSDKDSVEELPKLTIDTRPRSILPYDPVRSCSMSPETTSSPLTGPSSTRRDSFEGYHSKTAGWQRNDVFSKGHYSPMASIYRSLDDRPPQPMITSGWT